MRVDYRYRTLSVVVAATIGTIRSCAAREGRQDRCHGKPFTEYVHVARTSVLSGRHRDAQARRKVGARAGSGERQGPLGGEAMNLRIADWHRAALWIALAAALIFVLWVTALAVQG